MNMVLLKKTIYICFFFFQSLYVIPLDISIALNIAEKINNCNQIINTSGFLLKDFSSFHEIVSASHALKNKTVDMVHDDETIKHVNKIIQHKDVLYKTSLESNWLRNKIKYLTGGAFVIGGLSVYVYHKYLKSKYNDDCYDEEYDNYDDSDEDCSPDEYYESNDQYYQ
jgi:hypothetical protein